MLCLGRSGRTTTCPHVSVVARPVTTTTGGEQAVPKRRTRAKVGYVEETDIIPTLAKLQQIIGAKLEFPRVVVVGNQSAGKSSVLEAIVGADILPKGSNMVTTRPLELTLIRESSGTWAQFQNGQKLFSISEIRDRILEENKETPFSEEPIRMEFHSPDVHNVTLVDLPGYILAIKQDQDAELPKHIKKLCESYVRNENNLIVCVVSASEDVAMSVGIKESRKYDRNANRSLGVLTKIDLRHTKDIVTTLKNSDYPMPLGYIGVMCRSLDQLNDGVDMAAHLKFEEEWLRRRKLLDDTSIRVGIPTLRRELSNELISRISQRFPSLLAQLDDKIAKVKQDEDFLANIVKEKDLTKVSKELEKLVNAFHPTSPTRLAFEKQLRETILDLTGKAWDRALSSTYGPLNTSPPTNMAPKSGAIKEAKSQSLARQYHIHLSYESPNKISLDNFSSFLIYGDGSPDKLEDKTLENLDRSLLVSALNTPFYSPVLSQDYQTQRLDWQRNLVETVEILLETNHNEEIYGLAHEIRKVAFEHLLNFVEHFAETHNRDNETARLARFFFRYLLEQVAARTDEDNLTKSLTALLLKEKRADAHYFEFVHAVRELLHVPTEAPGWLEVGRNFPIPIVAYEDIWTKAYFEVVKKRSGNEIFRLLAVELINPLIFETIHYSLNLFKSGRVARESSKQLKVIQELEYHREVLAKAAALQKLEE